MLSVTVPTGVPYDVQIGVGLLDGVGERIRSLTKATRVMLVTDDIVAPLYSARVRASLESAGFAVSEFVFANGEAQKRLSTLESILEQLAAEHFTRSDLVVALGGGVVGDLAGFAAAVYARGIDYVQVPTTLLAAVDSSVGGKTAVNLPGGKNQVGAFHQPALVLCDPDLLHSLPPQEYQNGCGELVKYAMLSGDPLYSALLSEPVSRLPEQVISACVEIKRDFVQSDEWDTGCRRLLNFGHTVGHAIENCSHYAVSHGQAVAIGMAVLTRAACHRGLCTPEALSDLERLLASYDLPTHTDFSAQAIARAALSDKKRRGDRLPLILPEAVGRCRVEAIPARDFVSWLRDGGLS